MKKDVVFEANAKREFSRLPVAVQEMFGGLCTSFFSKEDKQNANAQYAHCT